MSDVGGVLGPHVAPSSKLYSILNPDIDAGGVTVKSPHPGLTVGAGGAGGKMTTLSILLGPHAPEPVAPADVVPQFEVRTYCA